MRSKITRAFAETTIVLSSGGFLAWYIWVKVATGPWHS